MLTLLGGGIFGALPEQAQKNVEMAEGDVSRLITLSDALIDVEGMANGRLVLSLKTVPFSNVIKRSVNSMGAFADQHGVEIEADETELLIFADEDRLVQVLVNLLSNAIKFSKAKMTVNIAVRPQRENAKLTVSDSGRGIPSDFIAKLFQPFQQAEEADAREKSGKGLGLAICKMIVEQHGGEIGVDSIYGRGSTFWFTVPLAEDPRATAIAQGSKTASTD
jgi:signal transduction histidine kinase